MNDAEMSLFLDRLGSGEADLNELKALTTSDREKMKSYFSRRREKLFYEQSKTIFGLNALSRKSRGQSLT